MKRRTFVVGAVATPLLASFARPEALTVREAAFEEIGTSLVMTAHVPGLFKKSDKDALLSIDSGFDTKLQYTLRVWEYGKRKLVTKRTVLVKIRFDPWKKKYVVSTRGTRGWSKRFFKDREAAIKAATTLKRVKVASTTELERGDDGPYYFVEVLALRNPLTSDEKKRRGASGRARGRDLELFGRLVELLAGERARAEETVRFRSNYTYLEPS